MQRILELFLMGWASSKVELGTKSKIDMTVMQPCMIIYADNAWNRNYDTSEEKSRSFSALREKHFEIERAPTSGIFKRNVYHFLCVLVKKANLKNISSDSKWLRKRVHNVHNYICNKYNSILGRIDFVDPFSQLSNAQKIIYN